MKRRFCVDGKALLKAAFCVCFILLSSYLLYAQGGDGDRGIKEATNQVKKYFESGIYLLYAIGAFVGLVGAVKVYNKWNSGEPDTSKVAASWFGSCIFLVVVATVLRAFFL